jgi:hypothetical protein
MLKKLKEYITIDCLKEQQQSLPYDSCVAFIRFSATKEIHPLSLTEIVPLKQFLGHEKNKYTENYKLK